MLEEIINERKRKLENLKNAGFYPYPETVTRTHAIKQLLDDFQALAESGKEIFTCGRIIGMRNMGGGFSAIALALVANDKMKSFQETLAKEYKKKFHRTLEFIEFSPSQGAEVLES